MRWCWGQIRYPIFGGEKFTFKDYLNGPQKSNDEIIDRFGHGLINNVIGIIVLVIILFFTVKYWT